MTSVNLTPPDRGALLVVSGPSGVGKSTLITRLRERVSGIEFSVSATTRAPRVGEVDGRDYYFLSSERFDELLAEEAFLEHAEVYGKKYGTLAAPIERSIEGGRVVILDIDVQGARQVRRAFPKGVHVFILPPDLAVLEDRLVGRSTDSPEVIRRRMTEVGEQLLGCPEFDYVVVNDDLETASSIFEAIVLAEMSRRFRRQSVVDSVLEQVDLHRVE